MKKMTRWGVGPKFGILTLLYSALPYLITTYIFPSWKFSGFSVIGVCLIVVGCILFIYPAVTIDKYFNNKQLRTRGLYAYVRHPIYAAWIVIIIPGIVLYWGAFLGLTIPFVAYWIFKQFIHVEEDYLLTLFGDQYRRYRHNVNAVFPKF
ncbi:MAG: isoprenylcysteine carboxylmethyltransferase family protein [Candidatus Absconditabacteria bacterium]